jgi:GTP-binding protein
MEIPEARAGDIVAVAGIEGRDDRRHALRRGGAAPLPRIAVDEPTVSMCLLREHLPVRGERGASSRRASSAPAEKELLGNVSLRIDFSGTDAFTVMGAASCKLAILIEMMRREGFELSVSRPEPVTRTENGVLMERVECCSWMSPMRISAR